MQRYTEVCKSVENTSPMQVILQTMYKVVKSDDSQSKHSHVMIHAVDFNLSGRCLNERNFDMLLAALSDCNMRITSLDLSFN